MTRLLKKALIAATALAAVTTGVHADLTLKEKVMISGDYLRAGDLFEGTGDAAETILAEAPAPGSRMVISRRQLSSFAAKLEETWQAPDYLKRVTVMREGIALTEDMVTDMMYEAALNEGVDPETRISLFGAVKGLYLPRAAFLGDVEIQDLTLNTRSSRLSATLILPQGRGEIREVSITGRMEAMRMVPTLSGAVTPGEVITAEHIRWEQVPARGIGRTVVQTEADLVGMTVRRSLRPGVMIRKNDVVRPVTVKKGAYVTMVYEVGQLTLTAAGRANENGGTGDIIRLVNTASGQSVEARVVSPDRVEIVSVAQLMAAN